jgi:hypothetical protein
MKKRAERKRFNWGDLTEQAAKLNSRLSRVLARRAASEKNWAAPWNDSPNSLQPTWSDVVELGKPSSEGRKKCTHVDEPPHPPNHQPAFPSNTLGQIDDCQADNSPDRDQTPNSATLSVTLSVNGCSTANSRLPRRLPGGASVGEPGSALLVSVPTGVVPPKLADRCRRSAPPIKGSLSIERLKRSDSLYHLGRMQRSSVSDRTLARRLPSVLVAVGSRSVRTALSSLRSHHCRT